jgi:hypothetical protein
MGESKLSSFSGVVTSAWGEGPNGGIGWYVKPILTAQIGTDQHSIQLSLVGKYTFSFRNGAHAFHVTLIVIT